MKHTRWLCLLLGLCLLGCATASADTHLMVVTDLHYIAPSLFEDSRLLEESARYGDGKTPQHSQIWLDAMVAQALALAPDALVLMGDQSYNGEVMSHRGISDALALVQDAGIDVLAIPGNHDINNDYAFAFLPDGTKAIHSIPVFRYEKYYGAYGLSQAFSRDEASFSYAVALTPSLWLLMIDACIFEPFAQSFGLIGDETAAWMEGLLENAARQGIQVITVTHQSLLPHSDILTGGYMILNWEEISDLLLRYGVRLNLSGHLHVQQIAQKETLYDVAQSSLSNQPNQYGWVTIADDGSITYEARSLDAALLPEGMLEAAVSFFEEASYGKVYARLRDSQRTPEEKAQMARFGAWLNRHYYAGTVSSVYEEALADPALALWASEPQDGFWPTYMQSMFKDATVDMTTLTLPAFAQGE